MATCVCYRALQDKQQVLPHRTDSVSFGVCSAASTAMATQWTTNSPLLSLVQGLPHVTPPWVEEPSFTDVEAPREDREDCSTGFRSAKHQVDAGPVISTPRRDDHLTDDDSDSAAARRLRRFTNRILRKVASPLLPRLPTQPTAATLVLPLRGKCLAA